MKQFSKFGAALVFAAILFASSASAVTPDSDPVNELIALEAAAEASSNWQAFSANLVDALKSDHAGLQHAAMRLVIKHGNRVNVNRAVFDVARIYRDSDDQQARRMAVIALSQMDSAWAVDYLKRSAEFEKSVPVARTIRAVLADRAIARS